MSEPEPIPGWAVELIKQVERLNEKIPSHINWVEDRIKDQEARIRTLEAFMWKILGIAGIIAAVIGALASWLVKVVMG